MGNRDYLAESLESYLQQAEIAVWPAPIGEPVVRLPLVEITPRDTQTQLYDQANDVDNYL